MAQKGMFGNQYQQAVTDETALRQQQSQTGGLTGWAAITNAMSGIGSEIGYQGGQAMGGQTPAQAQQARFQSVIDSVPDYDPMNPESVQQMSSALWNGGFYDEGMAALNQSKAMQVDDAKIALYAAQKADLDRPPALTPEQSRLALREERINQAAELTKGMPRETTEEMLAVSKILEDGGYTQGYISQYQNLQSNLSSRKNTEINVGAKEKAEAARIAKITLAARKAEMEKVMPSGQGDNIVGGYFINNPPDVGGDTADLTQFKETLGGEIESYDKRLSLNIDSKVTPAEAYPYYERILQLQDIYDPKQGWFDNKAKFDTRLMEQTLNTIFAQQPDLFVPNSRLMEYRSKGLLVPGVTIIEDFNKQKSVFLGYQIK